MANIIVNVIFAGDNKPPQPEKKEPKGNSLIVVSATFIVIVILANHYNLDFKEVMSYFEKIIPVILK